MSERCPRTDPNRGQPDDVHEVACPDCGEMVEFFKDEPRRICPRCKAEVRNPRLYNQPGES